MDDTIFHLIYNESKFCKIITKKQKSKRRTNGKLLSDFTDFDFGEKVDEGAEATAKAGSCRLQTQKLNKNKNGRRRRGRGGSRGEEGGGKGVDVRKSQPHVEAVAGICINTAVITTRMKRRIEKWEEKEIRRKSTRRFSWKKEGWR